MRMRAMLAFVLLAFVLGGLFFLLVAATAWFYTAAVITRETSTGRMPPFKPPTLPQVKRWQSLLMADLRVT